MTALVRGVMRASKDLGSRHQLPGSTSANTGVAPTYATALAVATQVMSGTMTSSPGPMPRACMAMCSAPVQLDVAIAWSTPR
jgi:hypothetical protein